MPYALHLHAMTGITRKRLQLLAQTRAHSGPLKWAMLTRACLLLVASPGAISQAVPASVHLGPAGTVPMLTRAPSPAADPGLKAWVGIALLPSKALGCQTAGLPSWFS